MIYGFSDATKSALKFYVYILCDNNDIPFYVGKGIENRVFEHEFETIDNTLNMNKFKKIESIRKEGGLVKKYIIHAGLSEDEAFACETALMNILKFLHHPLTNIMDGKSNILKNALSVEQIESKFGTPIKEDDVFDNDERKDGIIVYIAKIKKPLSSFSIDDTISYLEKNSRDGKFFKKYPQIKHIAIFHNKIFEGYFDLDISTYDEVENGKTKCKAKFSNIVPNNKYIQYIGLVFDVNRTTNYPIRLLNPIK